MNTSSGTTAQAVPSSVATGAPRRTALHAMLALLMLATLHPGDAGRLRAGPIYKSVDAAGHVVYSDHAETPAAEKTDVHVAVPDPDDVARLAKEQEILRVEDAQRKKQQSADDAKKAQGEHDKAATCGNARSHYYSLKDARRVFHRDADGNRIYYTDADADLQREQARQAMTAACDG
jgi:hypothetical protein